MSNGFSIGSVELKNRCVLGPMAGVTDRSYRQICSQMGAGLVCSEMVSAKAITYRNRNTQELLAISPQEHPVSLQLFGSEPDVLTKAIEMIEEVPYDILDFNMGCPVPKVVKNREGSALMKEPALARELFLAMVKASDRPVTVKMRKGFSNNETLAVELAKIAEDCGISAVAIHGRTREQFYSGEADWEVIRQVKDAVSIPVIGNGDVTDEFSAKAMLEETGCDAIMIGRAAEGNPWLFQRIPYYLETGKCLDRPTEEEIKKMIFLHAQLLMEEKGEYVAIREMRKHISWYTTGLKHSAKLRREINLVESYEEMKALIDHVPLETQAGS